MGLNEYDDAVEQLEPAPAQAPKLNEYAGTIDAIDLGKEQGLRASTVQAADKAPDQAAEVLRLSDRLGIPAAVVERNFDDIKKRATIADTPYARMLKETPHLSEWASEPAHAAIAKDDMENLGALEWLTTAPQRAFSQGVNQFKYGTLRAEGLFRDLSQQEKDLLSSYKFHMDEGGELGAGNSWFKGAITGSAQQLPNLFGAALYGLKYGIVGAGEGAAVGAGVGALVGGVGAIPGAIAGAGYGFRAGMIYGGWKTSAQLESGLAYDEYLDIKDETGQPLDPKVARAAALATGAINGGIELLALAKIVKSIPGLNKLGSLGVRSAVTEALKVPTVRAALFEAVKSYTGTLTTEVATEIAQRAVTILSGELAKTAENVANGTTSFEHRGKMDVVQDLIAEGAGAIQGFALTVLPGPAMSAVMGAEKARRAEHGATFFKALGDAVTTSKTFERLPSAAQAFVEKATKDGPIEKVYAPIETWNTYWQSKGIDPAVMAEEVTGDAGAYEHAVNEGGDLAIPTARYAVKLAATDHNAFFVEELRLGPEEMNGRESAAFVEQQKAAAEAGGSTEGQKTPPSAIRAALMAELEAAHVPAATAQRYADLYESAIGAMAERRGIDPTALYARYGLKVERPDLIQPETGRQTREAAPGAKPAAKAPEAGATLPLEPGPAPGLPAGQSERREADAGPPAGTADRRAVAAAGTPAEFRGSVASRVAEMEAENPAIGREAAAAQANYAAQKAARSLTGSPSPAVTSISEGLDVDTEAAADEDLDPDAREAEASRRADRVRDARERGIPASRPRDTSRGREKPDARAKRRAYHYDAVFVDILQEARALDPNVDDVDLRAEFDFRVDALESRLQDERESGHDATDLLTTIAGYGGINAVDSTFPGEVKFLRDGTKFGKLAGVAKVFQKSGLSIDLMVSEIQQDARFHWITSANILIDAIDDAARQGEGDDFFPGSGELWADVKIDPTARWWEDPWRPVNLAEADQGFEGDALEAGGAGDTSFNVSEFDQSLFDDLEVEAPDEQTDELTGKPKPVDLMDAVRAMSAPKAEFDWPEVGGRQVLEPGGSHVAATKERIETDDDVSLREWQANASEVARDPASASSKDLRRAVGYLSHALQGLIHNAQKEGRTLSADVVAGYDNEMAWYTRLANAIDEDGGDAVDERKADYDARRLAAAEAAKEPLPAAFESLDALDKRSNRGSYNPDVLTDALIATLKDAGLVTGRTQFKLTDEGRRQLREWRDVDKANQMAAGDAYDNFPDYEAAPAGDVLDTGEVQPRLPGAGEVRDLNVQTPEFEAPFSLTAPTAKGAAGKQTTLFQGETIQETLEAWAADVKARAGEDLTQLEVYITNGGDLHLSSLVVDRGAQRAGLGSRTMQELTRFADLNGLRVTLKPGSRNSSWGTTSRSRLVAFYKRFGFVENKGRSKDFAIDADAMYREPTLPTRTLGQPAMARPASLEQLQAAGFDTSRVFFHQTHLDNVSPILTEGFDLAKGRARLSDEQVPDGVFFKPTEQDIGVGGMGKEAAQIPVFLRFGETRTFADRDALAAHLERDPKYKALAEATRLYDKEQAKTFDQLWADLRSLDAMPAGTTEDDARTRHAANKIEVGLDTFVDDWKLGNDERATVARARATEILRAQGIETVILTKDQGSGKRSTETIIAIGGDQVASAQPGAERVLFQDEKAEPRPRRGSIRFGSDRQMTIALLERADLSTFLHESGHFFLEVFADLAGEVGGIDVAARTPQQAKLLEDFQILTAQLEDTEHTGPGFSEKQHEQFARQFEAYLFEGKAPTLELQAAFSRFRAWLIGVYRSLKNLRVNLTDEVRGVMDRLVASDQAIADAEARRNTPAMFTTAALAGMDEKTFELYRATIEQASQTARDTLDRKLLAEVQREQTAAWKEQRAEIEAEVSDDVYTRPAYRAIAAMQNGEHPNGQPLVEGLETPALKLSKAILVERYGDERLRRLPRPYVYTVEGGMDPNTVAELFGFSSGDAMLTAIEEAPPMRAVIQAETNRRMLETHGSILLDGSLHEKAQLAIASEDRDAIIRAELLALGRLRRTVDPFVKAERAAGKRTLEHEIKERAYERRWFEAEAQLAQAIAVGRKQSEIDVLEKTVRDLRARARGGAAVIRAAIPPAGSLRDMAKARLATMRIGDINPAAFWSASRRAAEQARDRAARQDYDGAIKAAQQELINLNLYRQAEMILEDIETRTRFALNLATKATRARIGLAGGSYLEQIDGILERFEFANVSDRNLARRASLRKWVEGMEAAGTPVELPAELLDEAFRRNYQDLTVEEFVGVTDGLKTIAHLVGLKNRLLKFAEKLELDTVAGNIADTIGDVYGKRALPLEFRGVDTKYRAVADWFASHTKIATIIHALDGYKDGGPMWEAVMRPLNAAADLEAVRKSETGKAFDRIIQDHYPGRANWSEQLEIPAIGGSLSREARIAVALNWGNQTSRDRLLSDPARKWNLAQVNAILETLDERDWKFVQATFDFTNTFWAEIAAKQERVTGLAPEKVEALPIQTKFGEIAGGYHPLKYDGRLSVRAGQHEAATDAKLATGAAYVQSTTKRGHIETRRSNVQLPIRLEIGVAFEHYEQVIHDLTHHEALIDATRVLRHSKVTAAILGTKHGDITYQQLSRGLQDIAIGSTPPARTVADKAANFARTGTQIAGLGWNLWTGAQQPLGLFNASAEIGPVWVARGMKRWLRDAASMENTAKWIAEVSPMMRERTITATQDLHDLRAQLRKPGGWFDRLARKVSGDKLTQQTVTDSFLWHIGLMQRVADIPTWLGAYEKAMATGTAKGSEERAIALADQAVLNSQGGGQIKDLAQVQRGGPIARLFMTFYSYGNTVFNSTRRVIGRTDHKSPAAVGRMLGELSLLYIAPAVATTALARVLGKSGGDDDTPEAFLADVASETLATALNTMIYVRELGGLAREGARGYAGPAGARLAELLYNVGKQVKQGEVDEALLKSLNSAAGVLLHYPAGQVQRSIDGFVALEEGRTSNPFALLVGAPPKKDRR